MDGEMWLEGRRERGARQAHFLAVFAGTLSSAESHLYVTCRSKNPLTLWSRLA